MNILVEDLNPHVREFFKRKLTFDGLNVITADSWREALHHALGSTLIDVLVVDPSLPDMDTKKPLRKTNNRIPPRPIILETLPGDKNTLNGIKTSNLVIKTYLFFGKII